MTSEIPVQTSIKPFTNPCGTIWTSLASLFLTTRLELADGTKEGEGVGAGGLHGLPQPGTVAATRPSAKHRADGVVIAQQQPAEQMKKSRTALGDGLKEAEGVAGTTTLGATNEGLTAGEGVGAAN